MAKVEAQRSVSVREREQGQTVLLWKPRPVHTGMLPPELGDAAIADLSGTDEVELRVYFDQLLYLPEIDTSLQVRLPGIVTPEMDRAINALQG